MDIIGIIGLSLSFVGAIIIFKFGLPPRVSESGSIYLTAEQSDKDEINKGKKYRIISRIGLGLLAAGFLLQLIEKLLYYLT